MECVLVFPLMLLLISMVLQFAHIWTARQITAYAAYCATRAIMAVQQDEQEDAAGRAAQLACSWMTLVGVPGQQASVSNSTWRTVHVGRLHGLKEIPDSATISLDDGAPHPNEVLIPGWGSIPGSDSVDQRVDVEIVENGKDQPFAEVTVHFKFPLVLPLVGRMISLFVNKENANRAQDGSYGDPARGRGSRWYGEENGDETVLDEQGRAITRKGHRWADEGKFPFITLTETCVLPMPYSTANFPRRGYASSSDPARVSDLLRGRDLR